MVSSCASSPCVEFFCGPVAHDEVVEKDRERGRALSRAIKAEEAIKLSNYAGSQYLWFPGAADPSDRLVAQLLKCTFDNRRGHNLAALVACGWVSIPNKVPLLAFSHIPTFLFILVV